MPALLRPRIQARKHHGIETINLPLNLLIVYSFHVSFNQEYLQVGNSSGIIRKMVELRKRREAPSNVAEPPLKKTTSLSEPKLGLESKAKAGPSPNGANKAEVIKVGHTVDLEGFGGEVETQDGEKATLKKLIDESKSGVVLFTYPKASTPGCQ